MDLRDLEQVVDSLETDLLDRNVLQSLQLPFFAAGTYWPI